MSLARMVSASCLIFVALAFGAYPGVGAEAQACVIEDPQGDAFWPGGAPAYEDVVQVGIAKKGSTFSFVMVLAGPIPKQPAFPVGVRLISWVWGLDTDSSTAPRGGFPLSPGEPHSDEFFVFTLWDGTAFASFVVDRRPLLAGEPEIVYAVPSGIKGTEIRLSAGADMLGSPSEFVWDAGTVNFFSQLGTEGWLGADGTAVVPWPC